MQQFFCKYFVFLMFFILLASIWWFSASFDVFVLFLSFSAVLILVFFLLINLTYSITTTHKKFLRPLTFFLCLYFVYLCGYSVIFFNFGYGFIDTFLLILDIKANDLFIYFYFMFIDFFLSTIYLTLILGPVSYTHLDVYKRQH